MLQLADSLAGPGRRRRPALAAGTSVRQRREMQRLMLRLVDHKARVHYAQIRPMRTGSIRPGHLLQAIYSSRGVTMDCSESVTLICRLAGLRDPNGRHYDGQGYTGTLLAYLPQTVESQARAGDLIVFGGDTGEHVCMVYQRAAPAEGRELILFSHGCEADPSFYPLSVMRQAFAGMEERWLSVQRLGFTYR